MVEEFTSHKYSHHGEKKGCEGLGKLIKFWVLFFVALAIIIISLLYFFRRFREKEKTVPFIAITPR